MDGSPAGEQHPGVPGDPRTYLPGGDPYAVDQPGVLAYFPDRRAAEEAARALRQAGLGPVAVDTVRAQPVDRGDVRQRPQRRVLVEDELGGGLPADPWSQTTTVVAVAVRGEDAARARALLRERGGRV
jgi:hypothetical protein